jgi:hypothetical protein
VPEITVKEAIDVLVRHAADVRSPSVLAAIKHVEEGLNTQEGTRPMDRHDSPGMQAAKRHTRPEYQNRPAKAASAPSPGRQAAQHPTDSREAKETSSDE